MEASLVLQGRSAEQARTLARTVGKIHQFRELGTLPPSLTADHTGQPQPQSPTPDLTPVFVSGFVYSGSGAVVEFLRHLPDISTWFSTAELGIFQGRYSSWRVLKAKAADRRNAVADFTSWSLLGVMPPYVRPPKFHRTALTDVLEDTDKLSGLVEIAGAFLNRLSRVDDRTEAEIREALRRVFAGVLALYDGDERLLLFSNGVRPYQAELLELMPNPRMLAVKRDPRDQFVAQCIERRSPADVESYIQLLRKRVAAFEEYLLRGKLRHNILSVSFERFLFDAQERARVLDFMGLDMSDADHLAAEQSIVPSRQNVGIYKQWEHRADISRIEDELGYLIPPS